MRKIILFVATALVAVSLSGVSTSASATPDHYVPRTGPAFNNPYGKTKAVRRLISQVNRTIDSVPRGGQIRISAWNVRSGNIANALIRAHRRKVSVQVVMDRANWNPNNPNVDARRLATALKVGNKNRPKSKKSFVRRCISSCRGKAGIPHSKFFLFNKVRVKKNKKVKTVRWVAMYGSYNATELGATIQWNDLYTVKNQEERYRNFLDVFDQMARDKPLKNPVTGFDDGVTGTAFYPYVGKGATGDPIMEVLNTISCTGAATSGGKTRIRIAQTSMYGDRGLALARKIAQLQRQGCNIRLVYAMFGTQVLKIMRAAKVPLTHLAYDNNEDGLYDRYVHMKTMADQRQRRGQPRRQDHLERLGQLDLGGAGQRRGGRRGPQEVGHQPLHAVDRLHVHPPPGDLGPRARRQQRLLPDRSHQHRRDGRLHHLRGPHGRAGRVRRPGGGARREARRRPLRPHQGGELR